MKILIIKQFNNCPGSILEPFNFFDLWDATAERAIKEGKGLEIPEGVDPETFRENYINELKKKK